MLGSVCIGERIMPAATAEIGVLNKGFLYGDGVFETLRVYGGQPFALGLHLQRLWAALEALDIVPPCSPAELGQRALATIVAAGFKADALCRLVVTRGENSSPQAGAGDDHSATVVVMVLPLPKWRGDLYARGAAAATVPIPAAADEPSMPAGLKTLSYLQRQRRLHYAKTRGAEEGICVDRLGRLVDGVSANVFVHVNDQWCTPPASVGARLGVTREAIMAALKAENECVVERVIDQAELTVATACCLTSSLREVVPIGSVDGLPTTSKKAAQQIKYLHNCLHKQVQLGFGGFHGVG